MSWNEIPADIRRAAEGALTKKQLDVLKLSCTRDEYGVYYGTPRIARMLSIAEPTAREHLRIAKLRLAQALEDAA